MRSSHNTGRADLAEAILGFIANPATIHGAIGIGYKPGEPIDTPYISPPHSRRPHPRGAHALAEWHMKWRPPA